MLFLAKEQEKSDFFLFLIEKRLFWNFFMCIEDKVMAWPESSEIRLVINLIPLSWLNKVIEGKKQQLLRYIIKKRIFASH